jgi:pyruvate,orthophosphate dikinase
MGRPCVTGASDVAVDVVAKTLTVADHVVSGGDIITVDGTNGVICLGAVPLRPAEPGDAITEFLSWTDTPSR